MTPMRDVSLRLYESLLIFYPREFREEYGREMGLVLHDQLRNTESGAGAVGRWLRAVLSLLVFGPLERMRQLGDDVRWAMRGLSKSPAVATFGVLIFALSTGAATAVFTLVNGLLIRPLPYPEASRLVYISEFQPRTGKMSNAVAFPNYLDLRARNRSFTDIGVYSERNMTIRAEESAERVPGAIVSHGVFPTLEVTPVLGRVFTGEEDVFQGPPVAVIGYDLWQRRFAGDPHVLGKTITAGDRLRTIVGVMPRDFRFPRRAELWLPLQLSPQQSERSNLFLEGVGRLRPGVMIDQATADLTAMMKQINRENPLTSYGQTGRAFPWRDRAAEDYRSQVISLLLAVGFVLLVACANLTSLLLCRASRRSRDMAVRCAMGAPRRRLLRMSLIESLLLSATGGAVGMVLSLVVVRVLTSLIPVELPEWIHLEPDVRVFGFAVLACTLAGLLAGFVPALAASRYDLNSSLKDGGRGSTDLGSRRWLKGLIVAEVAVTLPLLAGAVLMTRNFVSLRQQQLGFSTERTLTLEIDPPASQYPTGERGAELNRRIRSELATLPGVRSVAAASGIPLNGSWLRSITAEGAPVLSLKDAPLINHTVVTPGYFRTMGLALLEGRDFTETDGRGLLVTIIDESLARKYWPNGSAIGKRVRFGPPEDNEPWHVVVGVAAEVRNQNVTEVGFQSVYLPEGEFRFAGLALLIRTSVPPETLTAAVRRRIGSVDSSIAVGRVRTMDQILDGAVWRERFLALLLAAFAAFSVLLAAAGLYGVVGYMVSRRTHEIGVRLTLGASAAHVQRMVIVEGLKLTLLGAAAGVVLALALGKILGSRLYGVRSADPGTLAIAACGLVVASVVAAFLPARNATQVDPVRAIQQE